MMTEMLSAADRPWETASDKINFSILPIEVNQLLRRDFTSIIVDVRQAEDFADGHVPGAINLPKGNWHRVNGRHQEWMMIIYGYSPECRLAAQAALEFAWQGCYPVMEMEGGFEAWKQEKLPVEK